MQSEGSSSAVQHVPCPRPLAICKLQPLPIPQRPWSHLGIDFITDLPPYREFTCTLLVVEAHTHGGNQSKQLYLTMSTATSVYWRTWSLTAVAGHLSILESILLLPTCVREPVLWLPSTDYHPPITPLSSSPGPLPLLLDEGPVYSVNKILEPPGLP